MCSNLAVQPEYNVLALNFGTDPAIGTDLRRLRQEDGKFRSTLDNSQVKPVWTI